MTDGMAPGVVPIGIFRRMDNERTGQIHALVFIEKTTEQY